MCCPYRCWTFMNNPFMNNPFMHNHYMHNPFHRYPGFMRQVPPPLKVKTKSIAYQKNYFVVDLRIPVFYDGVNQKIINDINNSVQNDIMEFKDQVEEGAKHDLVEEKHEGEPINPYKASNVYEVTYNKNGILSMTLLYNALLHGLNNYVKTGYTYDTITGNSMSLGDLFKPGTNYKQVLNNEIRREIAANTTAYPPNAAASFKGIADDQPFYLQDNSLAVFFGFNEVAPISASIPIISIPFSRISSILRPRILK